MNVLINESTMKSIGNAIRRKTGGTDLILPRNMANEIDGISAESSINPIEYISYFFNIENKDEWKCGEFTLLSDMSNGYITIANPANKIPEKIIIFKKDIVSFVKECAEKSINDFVVGGYNDGNTNEDSDVNRTLLCEYAKNESTDIQIGMNIKKTLYNLINSSCPSVGTSEYIYVRADSHNMTKWYSGDYYIAVKA